MFQVDSCDQLRKEVVCLFVNVKWSSHSFNWKKDRSHSQSIWWSDAKMESFGTWNIYLQVYSVKFALKVVPQISCAAATGSPCVDEFTLAFIIKLFDRKQCQIYVKLHKTMKSCHNELCLVFILVEGNVRQSLLGVKVGQVLVFIKIDINHMCDNVIYCVCNLFLLITRLVRFLRNDGKLSNRSVFHVEFKQVFGKMVWGPAACSSAQESLIWVCRHLCFGCQIFKRRRSIKWGVGYAVLRGRLLKLTMLEKAHRDPKARPV